MLALGYRASDMFTTLDLGDMVAIAAAAPQGTAVFESMSGGWTREAHLLANMQEGNAGLGELNQRYDRPGMSDRANPKFVPMDDYSMDEFDKMLEANYALGPSSEMVGMK